MRHFFILISLLAVLLYGCRPGTQYMKQTDAVADGYKGAVKRVTCTSIGFIDTSGIPFHDTVWPATVIITEFDNKGAKTREEGRNLPDDGFLAIAVLDKTIKGDSEVTHRTIRYSREDSTPTASTLISRWLNDSTYHTRYYVDEGPRNAIYSTKTFDKTNGRLLQCLFPSPAYNASRDTTDIRYTYSGDSVKCFTSSRHSPDRDTTIAVIVARDAHGNATTIKIFNRDKHELYRYSYEYYPEQK